MSVELGQTIDGKYKVVRRIGEGGMGTVYEGENVRIGRKVAIKVLHAQVAARPEFAERFEREARAAARIGSDHVCDVLDLGDLPNGERFMVMEFLEGMSLEQRFTDAKRLTGDQLLTIAYEILEALATMHEAGVIHRDLKPANVFLAKTASGRGESVKILDFGVSKFLPAPGESSDMTATGTLMGTPLYMSPEQARGQRDIDGRADVYAASVMFYRALTGILPFTADNFNELMFKIALEDPKPIREVNPDVDAELAGIIHRGLARAPDGRWESARKYQEALVAWAKKQGRFSLSMLRVSASEKALAAAARAKVDSTNAPPISDSKKDGTPYAWSEAGPVPHQGDIKTETLVLGKKENDPATAQTQSAPPTPPVAVAQTTASAGQAKTDEAVAKSQATPAPARARLVIAAVAAGAVALGALGFVAMRSSATKEEPQKTNAAPPPPPSVATVAPAATPTPTEVVEPPPIVEPSATAPARPTATTHVVVRQTAVTAANTSTATPPATATTQQAPATSASSHARKFRTNIE